jgi:hypothetical protein
MAIATRSKPKAIHKKRRAQHHRKNQRYLKTYMPYLPLLAVMAVGIFINGFWNHHGVLGGRSDYSVERLLSETNQQRDRSQLRDLTIDPHLTAAAQSKATEMVQLDYWSHLSPGGKTPAALVIANGYQYQLTGENLAYGFDSAGSVIAGWMGSIEHRQQLLDENYSHVGFGVAQSENYLNRGPAIIVVAEFGQPATGQAAPAEKTTELDTRPVSRVELINNDAPAWSLMAVVALASSAMTIFVVRHGFRLQRIITRGEHFVLTHVWFDVAVLAMIVIGLLLTRTSGIIG